MTFICNPKIIQMGGGIILDFRNPKTGVTSLQGMAVVTRNGTAIFSGDALDCAVFIDVGDGDSGPLSDGVYNYQVTQTYNTVVSVFTIDPVTLSNSIELLPDGLDALFIRLLQGGIQSMILPSYIPSAPRVTNDMPISNLPPLPFITVNTELLQQTDVPLGQQIENADSNNLNVVPTYVKRVWRISVLDKNAAARNYWRDYVIASFPSIATVFSEIGQNFSHRFQAADYQVANMEMVPGFYGADIIFEFEGNMTAAFKTSYPFLTEIDVAIDANGTNTEVKVTAI